MNFTAPWAWSASRRSYRRPGPEEGRSRAEATGRQTLNVRGLGEAGASGVGRGALAARMEPGWSRGPGGERWGPAS